MIQLSWGSSTRLVFHNFSWYAQSWGMLRCLLFPQNPEKPQTRQSCPVRTRVWLKSVSSLPELACGCCNGADGFWLHQRVADGHVHHFSAAWVPHGSSPLGTSMYLPKIGQWPPSSPASISPTKGGFLSWLNLPANVGSFTVLPLIWDRGYDPPWLYMIDIFGTGWSHQRARELLEGS